QVAIGEVGDFVEQAQNGGLVAFVLFGGLGQTAARVLHHHQSDEDNGRQGQEAQQVTGQGVQGASVGLSLEADSQFRSLVQQGLRQAEDAFRRFANLEQFRRGFQDLVYRAGDEFEQL